MCIFAYAYIYIYICIFVCLHIFVQHIRIYIYGSNLHCQQELLLLLCVEQTKAVQRNLGLKHLQCCSHEKVKPDWSLIVCLRPGRNEDARYNIPCIARWPQRQIHTNTHIHTHTYIHTYMRTYIHTHTYIHIPTYVHTYIHTYIHTNGIHTSTYIQTHTFRHIHTNTYIQTRTYTPTHIHININTHIHIHIHIHMYMYMYIYIYTYIHAHTDTRTCMRTYIPTYILYIMYAHTYKSSVANNVEDNEQKCRREALLRVASSGRWAGKSISLRLGGLKFI